MENITTVEWLAKQLSHPKIFNPYIEQAKEMEKQQIIDAFNMGMEEFANDPTIQVYQGEQYYNETYNK